MQFTIKQMTVKEMNLSQVISGGAERQAAHALSYTQSLASNFLFCLT